MVEFTGERVIPGQVSDDLWSEHFARYAFARRFAAGKWVLDAGCGSGYGAAELAQTAGWVAGIDLAPDAARAAAECYPLPNAVFAAAACETLPFASGCFDLVVAFEVIEHLTAYRDFLNEAARVLAPDGVLLVSTPNKAYYAESRAESGPNPFHQHEFEAAEFEAELSAVFPHVRVLLQNRVESFAFHPEKTYSPADIRIDAGGGLAAEAHFLVAVCSHAELPPVRSLLYVPRAANILREREIHIRMLRKELEQTKQWLAKTAGERDSLLDLFRKQNQELEEHNRWAEELSQQLTVTGERVTELQDEVLREQAAAFGVAEGYARKVAELERENVAKTEWARGIEARLTKELTEKAAELADCVKLLEAAEATVEERTRWAQRAEAERAALFAQLNAARASRWLKAGRRLGLGPALEQP